MPWYQNYAAVGHSLGLTALIVSVPILYLFWALAVKRMKGHIAGPSTRYSPFGTNRVIKARHLLTQPRWRTRIKVTIDRLPAKELLGCVCWLWKTTLLWPVLSVKDWKRSTTRSMWRPTANRRRHMALESDYDLLILDLNLPKLDGIGVLSVVRPKKPSLPVLVLTARSRVEDRVQSLDSGADDCLIKPFSFTELSARVRALLRRGPQTVETVLRVADLELDRVERKVERAGKRIDLTSKEFALLEYLMRNAGRRITRAMIVEHVWNLSFDTTTNIVDVYINYLRKKVDGEHPPHLDSYRARRGIRIELPC